MGGGATFFLTSLLDHPDFTDEHLALHALRRARRLVGARRGHRAGRPASASRRSAPTAAPSTRRSPARLIDEPEAKRLYTDGHALPGVEIRLDEHGEISSRGPDCFVGYTDPALTASVFDADGWYRTGDVGVLDDDGYLTITDRVSDIIIRGGENISAQEVEELLLGLDGVAEVARGRRARRAPRRARRRLPAPARGRVAPTPRGRARPPGRGRAWPSRSGPSRSTPWTATCPRTPSGKVQKYRLRQSLPRRRRPGNDVLP